ncbi:MULTISPECIES: peptide-methionine (S)-S-oxide reductase MsrA [unclassified Achromobacter]|uniref:peptide-methionine (S)-S-oxide reductase MsrA n=1 Tax=unclassified Achromobacter TaxID=2626865 RepID=UPI000B51B974|nr:MULTISPECIES: peptide-methionine (S)-S-oxide reductase MsrA [unclassified Achromobacter]OWT68960.1 peptide-methionine (S)-S-oxide reductase [Achromobacter sp. HZ28]OWT78477.1 peptide-methionine (S)-S-oxide reductase [Achromobacter sp. HZ34]
MNSRSSSRFSVRRLPTLLAGAGLGLAVVLLAPQLTARAAEQAVSIAAPAVDEPASTATTETAVFAGGCFWGVQGVFQHVKGVTRAVSGYAGGAANTAQYEVVSEGRSGHAESVQVTFDPRQISYGKLLQIYFSVAHDPTQLNRQGPDSGTQYRSTIFPASAMQHKVAEAYIAQLNKSGVYGKPIVTTLEDGKSFYPAEAYHQDFLVHNPNYPYIVYNDLPKIKNLQGMFGDLYRDQPVLVAQAK